MSNEPIQDSTKMSSQVESPLSDSIDSGASAQLGEISLVRSSLPEEYPMSSETSADINLVPEASSQPTNTYAGIAPIGSTRNPSNAFEFLPCTQNVLRGGFRKLPREVPLGDPDPKYMLPHYPPKSNDFYELTSDGHLSENYFENNRLRAFMMNPDLSIISAGLSPTPNAQEVSRTPPTPARDRIYIGTGNYRPANETLSPLQEEKQPYRHKYAQMPTLPGSRPWQQEYCQNESNDEYVQRVGLEEMLREHKSGQVVKQLTEENTQENEALDQAKNGECERQSTPTSSQNNSIRSDEGVVDRKHECKGSQERCKVWSLELSNHEECGGEGREAHTRDNNIHDQEGDMKGEPGLERGLAQCTIHALEERQNQALASVYPNKPVALTEAFPSFGAYTHMPGDRSGDNFRTGRTRTELESKIFPEVPDCNTVSDDVSLTMEDVLEEGYY